MQDIIEHIINNDYVNALPKDPITENYTRTVEKGFYSDAKPEISNDAEIIHVSKVFAKTLGYNQDDIKQEWFADLVTGKKLVNDTKPFAMNYGGHQFGHWAGQLGDGRAINLYNFIHKNKKWSYQLKGSGKTPYSRNADGLAVLRSSIREHLCSEAMHCLGIPTTRSLSLSLTGTKVLRDMLYDGHPAYEQGAVVCRVSESFLRFGSFEIWASRQDIDSLKLLVDFTIKNHFPKIKTRDKEAYIAFFKEVAASTLSLAMHWQRVGFVHGVMNTDNMSILGLTIDYGPYGWLEPYDPNWTPNTTDHQHKRYRYGKQPEVALWNLLKLANALYPLIEDAEPLERILNEYKSDYLLQYEEMMHQKIGLNSITIESRKHIETLEEILQVHETDMTLFYRELSKIQNTTTSSDAYAIIHKAFYNNETLENSTKNLWLNWLQNQILFINTEFEKSEIDLYAFAKARQDKMNRYNPKYVLRNYMSQLAINDAEKGNYELINDFYTMLQNPYDEQPTFEKWYALRPEWAREKVGCSMLSCSS